MIGRAAIALVGLAAIVAALWLWLLPAAVIENAGSTPVKVRLETDVGESWLVESLSPGDRTRILISGRDKAIWAVVEGPDGRVRRSKEVYATTTGTLRVRVTDETVEARVQLPLS